MTLLRAKRIDSKSSNTIKYYFVCTWPRSHTLIYPSFLATLSECSHNKQLRVLAFFFVCHHSMTLYIAQNTYIRGEKRSSSPQQHDNQQKKTPVNEASARVEYLTPSAGKTPMPTPCLCLAAALPRRPYTDAAAPNRSTPAPTQPRR